VIPSEDLLQNIIEKLDSVVKWLSHTRLKMLSKGARSEIIEKVVEETTATAINEFCNFIEVMRSERYLEILKALGLEGATWTQIKRYLEIRLGTRIYDSELARLLRNLVDSGFIEKINNMYVISDPILRQATKKLRCRS